MIPTILCGAEKPDAAWRHTGTHLLTSDDLSVELMDPFDPERYNRGVRFSPIANVLQVVTKGRPFLYSPIEHEPKSENGGLAMEFDISAGNPPPGFSEAPIGGGFLKIGVGVLRKDAEIYHFINDFELIEPAHTRATWDSGTAHFEQSSTGISGYAYKLNADVAIKANTVEVTCVLTNTGKKPFTTEQYTHNYLSLDGAPVGPNYLIQFPRDFEATGLQPEQQKNGREILFRELIPPSVKAVNAVIAPLKDLWEPGDTFTISNPLNGMRVGLSTDAPVSRFAIHAIPRYFCPEMFIRIQLQPGESKQWIRRYEFHADHALSAQ